MRLGTIPGCIGVALVALAAASVAGATSTTSVNSQVPALKRVGLPWVTYVANGNAPRACHLQIDPSVGGTPCDQLPTYFESLYCPAIPPSTHDSPWRTPAQLLGNAEVKGGKGTIFYRAANKKSKLTAKATFYKVGGKWRIGSIQSGGRRLSPAGLIFTEGKELRQKLWPAHC